jgi:hypothetical protein
MRIRQKLHYFAAFSVKKVQDDTLRLSVLEKEKIIKITNILIYSKLQLFSLFVLDWHGFCWL